MADLFLMTAPLMIRLPDGERCVMAEYFRHPKGLLVFRTFWHVSKSQEAMFLVEGEVTGEGPWKVGRAVVNVLGCHGTDPGLAAEFDAWRDYLTQADDEYPPRPMVLSIARARGAVV